MFGYVTFNVKYYILSQIFYKKNRVCVYYLVFATCLWHNLFIWNPSTSCSKNCSRSARRGIERELQDQSQNALLCYRAWYAFATELGTLTDVREDGWFVRWGNIFKQNFFVQVDSLSIFKSYMPSQRYELTYQ